MLVKKYYTPKDIQTNMKKAHEISLTYIQVWRGKQRAFKLLRGDPAESYEFFFLIYLYIFVTTYPGIIVNLNRRRKSFLYHFLLH